MRLYHGSNGPVPGPRITGSSHTMDLGNGFYASESLEQAERWAEAVERNGWDENTAISRFMNSEVYDRLQDESAKVWHFSPLGLYELFDDELDGRLEWPEV